MRPSKERRLSFIPPCSLYKPQGVRGRELRIMTITMDALEALRLVDGEGLAQEEAARAMNISTPTLCRILSQARQQVARALCNGWGLHFEGGNYRIDTSCHERGFGRNGPCLGQMTQKVIGADAASCALQGETMNSQNLGSNGRSMGRMDNRGKGQGRSNGRCCGRGMGRGNGQCDGTGRRDGSCRRGAANSVPVTENQASEIAANTAVSAQTEGSLH